MPKIELSIKEKICLAGLTVLGKDYLAEAFDMCHNVKTTNQGSLSVMRSKWLNSDRVKGIVINPFEQALPIPKDMLRLIYKLQENSDE